MTKKTDREVEKKTPTSRRDLLMNAAALGVGAASLGAPDLASAAVQKAKGMVWDYEADVVVLGGGGAGLIAAVRARSLGASVILLDQNFDVGGKLSHSSGFTSLGGGDAIQARDIAGTDPQGLGLTRPLLPKSELEDSPDLLFTDLTDWSVVDSSAVGTYRYNDREQHRAWADNAPKTRQFLMDNYVRFARIHGTHEGGGMSRARAARAIMKLGDKTDIKAGTVSMQDKGSGSEERSALFNPMYGPNPGPAAAVAGAPGWVWGGFALSRPLEFSAREKGVTFMVNRHLDEIIREQPFSGRVLGVRASYSPRFHPKTGERLEGYWKNGNIDERRKTISVRAKKAIIVATGGFMGNPVLRTMVDPRMSEPSIQYGKGLMGPRHEDGSGVIAGLRIGATLGDMMQNYQHRLGSPLLQSVLGTSDRWEALFPGHPAFLFIKALGIEIGNDGWEHVVNVNQVGKRFYNESAIATSYGNATYPPGADGTNKPFTPTDWRNSSIAHVRRTYNRGSASDAALAMNEGSTAPDYSSGPVWAIFDQAAVDRNKWPIRYPYIAEPSDGYFVKANTLAELSRKVVENEHQKMPLKYLEATIARYNELADKGVDEDFEKPKLHRIDKAPFYAAIVPLTVNDSYGGLRINGKTQVLDLEGQVIPGLYAGGEASGGGRQHGIGRATVHGYIAGTHAVAEKG